MRMRKIVKQLISDRVFLILFLSVITVIYSVIAIASHNHYETFAWDLGYFDQVIWKVSRGIFPFSTLSHVNLLAGHFAPILFLYAPLYRIWPDPRILLIVQAFIMVFGAWPLYFLASNMTKSKIFSFAVVFSYLFFLGTQWSILNEFHEATVVPLLLALIYWSLEKRRKIIFWLSVILLLLTKEEMALLAASVGLTARFHFKLRNGIYITIGSILLFLLLVFSIMPSISESGFYYQQKLSPDTLTPGDFLQKILTKPLFVLSSFVTPPQKISVLITSFLSFGLIPLFAPIPILFPLAEQFLMRFIYTGPQFTFWQNVNHHAAPTAMLLALAAIYGAVRLSKKIDGKKGIVLLVLSIVLFSSTLIQDIYFRAPVHSVFKRQLYETPDWVENINYLLTKIPDDAVVAAQNNISPHLSRRRKIYLLPEIYKSDYIIVDLVDGPNKFSPLTYDEMKKLVSELVSAGSYMVYYQRGEAILLKKR